MLNPKAKLTELNRAKHALARDPDDPDCKARCKAAQKAFDDEVAAVEAKEAEDRAARHKEQQERIAAIQADRRRREQEHLAKVQAKKAG